MSNYQPRSEETHLFDTVKNMIDDYRESAENKYKIRSENFVVEVEKFPRCMQKIYDLKNRSCNPIDRKMLDKMIEICKEQYTQFTQKISIRNYQSNKFDHDYKFRFEHIEPIYDDFQYFFARIVFEFTAYSPYLI